VHRDAYYTMGADHTACQDFAMVGSGLAVVSDGCSSSEGSDWGARLLAASAIRAHLAGAREDLAERAVHRAQKHVRVLGLPLSALDATLGIVDEIEGSIRARLWGDGAIVVRTAGKTLTHTIEFESGAPLYPSYLVEPELLRRWRQSFGDVARITGPDRGPHLHDVSRPFELRVPIEPGLLVAITTDGISAIRGRQGNVPPGAVAEELVAIPSLEGRFVTRRVRRMISRRRRDDGWVLHDDLAIAALCVPVSSPKEPA
jgi:hypothetical protein